MAIIKIKNISKRFGTFPVLQKINLRISDGEFIVVFGPNGCGKSTLLNMLAGLEEPSAGSILIDHKPVREAKIGFVFQNFQESLFPWRTVLDNVGFAFEVQGIDRKEARKKAMKFVKEIGLEAFAYKFPYHLSGGMKQLVAIARARAYNPNIFLLDEPFSALDYQNKVFAEEQLLKVWQENKKTTLFVSHDVEEAVFLADKVVILSKRPAFIKKIIPITLPRPRSIEMRLQKKFFALQSEILKVFKEELE